MSNDNKLVLKNVSKKFDLGKGKFFYAIKDISITVPEGRFVSILGPSGCGKTTLLKIVAGLVEPSEGEVLLDGNIIDGPGVKCGYVPQAYTLFPWLTVAKNIEFGLQIKKIESEEINDTIDKYLDLVALKEYRDFYPKSLSGGMKQRVAIARTMAVEPDVLLMDEPFGALDTQTRAIMQENLLDIWEKTKKTVLFVTHDIEEAIYLSDDVYISSSSPGTVITRIQIELPRNRDFHLKTKTEFIEIKRQIIDIMREDAIKAVNQFK